MPNNPVVVTRSTQKGNKINLLLLTLLVFYLNMSSYMTCAINISRRKESKFMKFLKDVELFHIRHFLTISRVHYKSLSVGYFVFLGPMLNNHPIHWNQPEPELFVRVWKGCSDDFKGTCYPLGKNSQNQQLLDILACNSGNKQNY